MTKDKIIQGDTRFEDNPVIQKQRITEAKSIQERLTECEVTYKTKDKYPNYQGKKSHAKRRLSANNSSGYAGVSYRLKDATWGASVFYCGKLYNIGQYKTKQQAVKARNKYIITHKMPHKLQLYI
ncbi:MAG: hypothetical protein DRI87_05630 [Bacteroidetes bacterium]|nr:MAG: hypothetical protein DRI87_05630 [Bacteroidota bacterium]